MLSKGRAWTARLVDEVGKWTLLTGMFAIIAIGSFLIGVLIDYVPLFLIGYPIGLIGGVFCSLMMVVTNSRRREGVKANEGE